MTYITAHGYRRLTGMKEHPLADRNGEVYEHRLVASQMLGRLLVKGEQVHHKNGDKLDNHPDNLMVCSSQRDHHTYHHSVVTDQEIRELILICGCRFRELRERGIRNTHRVQSVFHALNREGYRFDVFGRRIAFKKVSGPPAPSQGMRGRAMTKRSLDHDNVV